MPQSAPAFPAFEDREKMSQSEQDALLNQLETERRSGGIFDQHPDRDGGGGRGLPGRRAARARVEFSVRLNYPSSREARDPVERYRGLIKGWCSPRDPRLYAALFTAAGMTGGTI